MHTKDSNKDVFDTVKKFCNRHCYSAYETCGYDRNATMLGEPMISTGDVCPLAKYGVPEHTEANGWPTLEDCDIACMSCENCGIEETGKGYSLSFGHGSYDAWVDICLDCPVWQTRESIEEAMAEARMS